MSFSFSLKFFLKNLNLFFNDFEKSIIGFDYSFELIYEFQNSISLKFC
jgi:hypothetical protein